MNKTTPTSTIEVLKAARELISVPERWTTGTLARDASGKDIYWDADSATCWCSVGAVRKVTGLDYVDSEVRAHVQRFTKGHLIGDFNDTHSHADVLALFDRAIANLESGSK